MGGLPSAGRRTGALRVGSLRGRDRGGAHRRRISPGSPARRWGEISPSSPGRPLPFAAAGPALRTGDWRGRVVTVCAGACIRVRLTDACQCYGTRLIDLDVRDFAKFADPSVGLLEVTISW